nr:hypothetical protein [uncultured Rhodopila sp.]
MPLDDRLTRPASASRISARHAARISPNVGAAGRSARRSAAPRPRHMVNTRAGGRRCAISATSASTSATSSTAPNSAMSCSSISSATPCGRLAWCRVVSTIIRQAAAVSR